jgi:ubiquinone/menaquinone biosynthesis C-methylase UbiE
MTPDVPSPIDFRQMSDAQAWEESAMSKRPWRTEFFARFAAEIAAAPNKTQRVLDLGSGPGFLAKHLLAELPAITLTLLDFSPAMHQLARRRIGRWSDRVEFVERSFKEPNWSLGLGIFSTVVTIQAVHELRHKRHAVQLHSCVREVLEPGGLYLVCDHFAGNGGMQNTELYMSIEEQGDSLKSAGFTRVDRILVSGGMALHRASS